MTDKTKTVSVFLRSWKEWHTTIEVPADWGESEIQQYWQNKCLESHMENHGVGLADEYSEVCVNEVVDGPADYVVELIEDEQSCAVSWS